MQLIVSTFANLNFTLFLIFDLRNSRHKFYGLYFVVCVYSFNGGFKDISNPDIHIIAPKQNFS